VEYDAQGRRLVTISVDLENAARAVNTDVAKAYINFYEVVFQSTGTPAEYYSATTTKGAGRRLSLRVPAVGTYKAYLNAGYLEADGGAVLLAQATPLGPYGASVGPWTFTLAALNLQVMGGFTTSADTDPIYVTFDPDGAATSFSAVAADTQTASGGIPYYNPSEDELVEVIVKPENANIANIVAYDGTADVVPLTKAPLVSFPTISKTLSGTTLTFSFTAPAGDSVSNIGFDIPVAALDNTRRANGLEPVRWHIRNGLNVDAYDNGAAGVTNTGAGIAFAFGTAKPEATDTYVINISPPNP
jgi:hypothetical protein